MGRQQPGPRGSARAHPRPAGLSVVRRDKSASSRPRSRLRLHHGHATATPAPTRRQPGSCCSGRAPWRGRPRPVSGMQHPSKVLAPLSWGHCNRPLPSARRGHSRQSVESHPEPSHPSQQLLPERGQRGGPGAPSMPALQEGKPAPDTAPPPPPPRRPDCPRRPHPAPPSRAQGRGSQLPITEEPRVTSPAAACRWPAL